MTKEKKRILIAKWFERLGVLAVGSLMFQGLFHEGIVARKAIIAGMAFALIFYSVAFYLVKKS